MRGYKGLTEGNMAEEQQQSGLGDFSEEDLRFTLGRGLRTVGVLTAIGIPIVWLAAGWRSMLLFLVGAVIAGTGIYEWQRLMMAVLSRFNQGATPRPIGRVLVWFFLRLALAGVLLYVSLRSLEGSVYALCAGLGLAVIALTIEAIRLLRSWSL
jgi:hypothetical protein